MCCLVRSLRARSALERMCRSPATIIITKAYNLRVWTGDNLGTWDHLAVSLPMILANGVGGMAWNGGKPNFALLCNAEFLAADVGGFVASCMLPRTHLSRMADSLAIQVRKCWCVTTKPAHSTRSSAPMHTSTRNAENPTYTTSQFADTCVLPCAYDIRCCPPCIQHSGTRIV